MDLAFGQVLNVIPPRLRGPLLTLPYQEQRCAEELRLRTGYPISIVLPAQTKTIGTSLISPQDLEYLLELSSQASIHSSIEQLRQGCLTIPGGHRVGLCGTAVVSEGHIQMLRSFSSASVRIARSFPGICRKILPMLSEQGMIQSTLVLAPPGGGKTSLLRDLIRAVSAGEGIHPMRTGVVDERGELSAIYRGVPQFDLGPQTDVMASCPKSEGLMLLLRSMNPQLLAVDEITDPMDTQALMTAGGCGTVLLATAHGRELSDLGRRPVYRPLMSSGLFRRLVLIEQKNGTRIYKVEVLS